MARKRGLSALMDGFNDGYETAGRVMTDIDMAKVANAKEEKTTGYSAADGAQLEAAANARDENGNPYYSVGTDASGKYTITPVNAPAPAPPAGPASGVAGVMGDAGTSAPAPQQAPRFADTAPVVIPMQERTNYLGKTYDAPLTDAQRDSARTMAMAGVYAQNGNPEKAMQLRMQAQQVDQMAKQGALTDLQIGQAQRSGARDEKMDAKSAKLDEIDKQVGDWTAKRLTNPDGTQREMSVDDHLQAGQYRASQLVAGGHLAEANALAKDNMSMAANKIQLQTAERNEAMAVVGAAVASGDLTKLGAFYDKFVPDGARVKNVSQDPKTGQIKIERETVDGKAVPAVSFKDKNELLAGLSTFKDPMALYNFSNNEFHRMLQINADKRAGAADGRAAAADGRAAVTFRQGQADRAATQEAGVNLFKESNPGATSAQLEAVRTGILPATPKPNTNATAEERNAAAAIRMGMFKPGEEKKALSWAHSKSTTAPDELFTSLVSKSKDGGDRAVKDATAAMFGMGFKQDDSGRWDRPEPMAPSAKFNTPADAEAAAKAGKLKPGDKVMIGGRAATYQ